MLKNTTKYDKLKKWKKEGINEMKDKQNTKKRIDKSKLFTRILAAIMAGLMLLGMCFTLIYYLIRMF
jgi:hypothetical protein